MEIRGLVEESLGSDEGRRRSRKDTRTWCKGKVGREHQTAVRIPEWVISLHARSGKPVPPCGPRERTMRNGVVQAYYSCEHRVYCTVCGKDLGLAPIETCLEQASSGGTA